MRTLSFVENRNWGEALPDYAYAEAICAIGLLVPALESKNFPSDLDSFPEWAFERWISTEAPLPWGSAKTESWRWLIEGVPPQRASALWAAFVEKARGVARPYSDHPRPLRLYFDWQIEQCEWLERSEDYAQLLQLFDAPKNPVDSFSLPLWDGYPGRGRKAWHWPLRVGSLPTPAGQKLLHAIQNNPPWFYETLLKFVDLDGSDDTCDLLIVPYNDAMSTSDDFPTPLHASAVVVFGSPTGSVFDSDQIVRVRDTARASAVVILPDSDLPQEQAARLFEALTHDEALDAAAGSATKSRDGWPSPRIFSEREFLARTRLKTVAWQHARWLARAEETSQVDRVRRDVTESHFNAEYRGASVLATTMVETSAAVLEKPRYLQTTIRACADNEKYRDWHDVRSFQLRTWHHVDAFIAELAHGAVSELKPFPNSELPEGEIWHKLRVAITANNCVLVSHPVLARRAESNFSPTSIALGIKAKFGSLPQYSSDDSSKTSSAASCELDLPEEGPSSFAGFLLMPLVSDPVDARVSVIYENRVLQTALLQGPVVAEAHDRGEPDDTIRLVPEGVVRASFQELDERRRFDAAFIFNHNATGTSQVTVVKDSDVKLRDVSGDVPASTEIGDVLVEATNDPDAFKTIRSAALRRLLVKLALKGVKIRDHFVVDAGFADSAEKPIRRIQILSARPEASAPLEFVYDGYAPDTDEAKLCPNHKTAMENGECGDCPHKRGAEYICALRFWGMSKVIERHQYRTDMPAGDYVRLNEAIGSRNAIPRPTSAVVAWSKNATRFPGGADALSELQDKLRAVATHAPVVTTWKKWRDEVKKSNPSLLLMLTHTDWKGSDAVLEIAAKEALVDGRIDDRIVGQAEPARIVVVLGCSTADRSRRYTSMPGRFRHAGADVVIATLTDILGRHAAPAARELLYGLDQCWENTEKARALGDVMTRLRRRLIAKGLPVGMALVAYGDADWRIE